MANSKSKGNNGAGKKTGIARALSTPGASKRSATATAKLTALQASKGVGAAKANKAKRAAAKRGGLTAADASRSRLDIAKSRMAAGKRTYPRGTQS